MSTLAAHTVSLAVRRAPHQPRHTAGRVPQRPLCAVCATGTVQRLVDLGAAPVIIGRTPEDVRGGLAASPLRLARCERCGVLQLEDTLTPDQRDMIAGDSTQRPFAGRPDCARRFCEEAIDRWRLRGEGQIIEVGSGTGSLLRFFRAWQLPVLGIEPDARLARYARLRRIPTWRAAFDAVAAGRVARSGTHADLLIVSTPLGATDDVVQLFAAAATVLRPGGVLTLELPDVLRIVGRTRFDGLRHADRMLPTIRQLRQLIAAHALDLVDVQRGGVAGDRLRVWIRRRRHAVTTEEHPRLRARMRAETANRIEHADTLAGFVARTAMVRQQIRRLLDHARGLNHAVALWGTSPEAVAMACAVGITHHDVDYAVDPEAVTTAAVLQGTSIPILAPADMGGRRPDLVLALDDLPATPAGWEGVPIYAVSDLVDVVHQMTGAPAGISAPGSPARPGSP